MNDFQIMLNATMTIKNILLEIKLLIVGHGDGKGPGDMGVQTHEKIFTNPFSKWLLVSWYIRYWSLAQYLSVKKS
jgi:hypothetical protein